MKNRRGILIGAAYVAGVSLDLASTLFCRGVFQDWTLSADFNPVVRHGQLTGLISWSAGMAALVLAIFVFGWSRRRQCYPAEPSSFAAFAAAFLLGRDPGAGRVHGRWGRVLTALAVLTPMVLALGHYRVAITNTLQGLRLFLWPSLVVFLTVRAIEVPLYLLLSLAVLHRDHRRT